MPKGKTKLVSVGGGELSGGTKCPRMGAVHPFGSLVMIELINQEELVDTTLHLPENVTLNDGAPQAYIMELGPKVSEDSGLAVGQRVYWQGTAIPVTDPRAKEGRFCGLLEMHQIKGIIEEE